MAASSVNQLAAAVLPQNERSQRLRKLSHRTWCPSGSIWTPKMCRTSAISAHGHLSGISAAPISHEETSQVSNWEYQPKSSIQLIFPQQICNWYLPNPIDKAHHLNQSFKCWLFLWLCFSNIGSNGSQRPNEITWPTSEASQTTRKCKAPWLSFVQPKVLGTNHPPIWDVPNRTSPVGWSRWQKGLDPVFFKQSFVGSGFICCPNQDVFFGENSKL